MKKEKPYNNGQWTEARFVSFVKSALRGARWPVKYEAVRRAYRGHGLNQATGKPCNLHECCACKGLFPQNGVCADHIRPIVDPAVGFVDWNSFIERMYCEVDGFQVLCKACHKQKTAEERAIATERRRNEKVKKE